MYKTKSEFKKRLMNDNNLIKYKQSCLVIIKNDEDFAKLNSDLNIPNNELETFLDENLFNDKVFLYKLESLIASDSIATKRVKEKFFKDEIKYVIDSKLLDIQYQNQIKKLTMSIDSHINNIQGFGFSA